MKSVRLCQAITIRSGSYCGSYAIKGSKFCIHHQDPAMRKKGRELQKKREKAANSYAW